MNGKQTLHRSVSMSVMLELKVCASFYRSSLFVTLNDEKLSIEGTQRRMEVFIHSYIKYDVFNM